MNNDPTLDLALALRTSRFDDPATVDGNPEYTEVEVRVKGSSVYLTPTEAEVVIAALQRLTNMALRRDSERTLEEYRL